LLEEVYKLLPDLINGLGYNYSDKTIAAGLAGLIEKSISEPSNMLE
jgi:hypothetical protein